MTWDYLGTSIPPYATVEVWLYLIVSPDVENIDTFDFTITIVMS